MRTSDIEINDRDYFICEALWRILAGSATEGAVLNPETARAIATYLAQLPPEDQLKPAVMANHITAFCLQPGNEELDEWLGEVYDRLDPDGIQNVVRKTGNPEDTADVASTRPRKWDNEYRDVCLKLQTWAMEWEMKFQKQHQGSHQKLMERLAELLGGTEQALIWLKSPHPVLDNRTPESYVEEGKLEVLEYFIHAIETGQPS